MRLSTELMDVDKLEIESKVKEDYKEEVRHLLAVKANF